MSAQETNRMVDFHEKMAVERLRSLQDLLKFFSDLVKDREQSLLVTANPAIDKLSKHVKEGGDLKCSRIDLENADRFADLLKFYKVPYFGIEQEYNDEMKVFFITRDTDENRLKKVMGHLDFELRTRLGWIDMEDFFTINEGDTALKINVTDEELPHFADRIFNRDVRFTVEFLSDGGIDIYFMPECREEMEKCIQEMADELNITESERITPQECILDKNFVDKILLRKEEEHLHETYEKEENDHEEEPFLNH